ncbi:hypothetical protein GCM10020000_16900 [Streptomyces olivoverticillatus]
MGAAEGEFGGDAQCVRARVEGLVAVAVGNGEAAAEVEFGEGDAVHVAQPGEQADEPADGGDVGIDGGDLGAEVAVQTDEFEAGLPQHAHHRVLGFATRDGQPELLALDAGAYGRVGTGGDARDDADEDALAAAGRDQGGEAGDFAGAVDDDPAHAEPQGGGEVGGALGVAVQDDAVGGEAGVGGEFELARRSRRPGAGPPRRASGAWRGRGRPCPRRRRRRRGGRSARRGRDCGPRPRR